MADEHNKMYLLEINKRPVSITEKNSAAIKSMKLKMYEEVTALILRGRPSGFVRIDTFKNKV